MTYKIFSVEIYYKSVHVLSKVLKSQKERKIIAFW